MPAKPPQNGPSNLTHRPGQSDSMPQPVLAGSLMHVVPTGQLGRPRLPQMMLARASKVAMGVVIVMLGVGHIWSE